MIQGQWNFPCKIAKGEGFFKSLKPIHHPKELEEFRNMTFYESMFISLVEVTRKYVHAY
jgi:hypothetical protein